LLRTLMGDAAAWQWQEYVDERTTPRGLLNLHLSPGGLA
jgi:hypothetical protein